MADHYEVLQVSPRAEPEVIRAAFRTLARKYHPDFGGDQRQMMAINEAWTVLGDRERRAAYDASRTGLRSRASAAASRQAAARAPRTTTEREQPAAPPPGPIAAAAERRAEARGEVPVGRQSGTVLDFGRYAGWSVGALATHDPDYLLWLQRTPIGRPLRAEIEQLMETRGAVAAAVAVRHGERQRTSSFRFRTR